MAEPTGQRTDPLITDLVAQPHRFSFFQAVRLLEAYVSRDDAQGSTRNAAVGDVQIRPNTSLACPPADLHDIEALPPLDVDDETERFRITVNFLGLYGVDSPLPEYYMEDFVRELDEDSPRRAFLDVFHQRIYWLLYQAWRKYRHYVEYRSDGVDDFSARLFALIGLADAGQRERLRLSPHRLLPFSAVLARREPSAASLEALLSSLLGLRVSLQEFVPHWARIAPDQRLRLGRRNSRLGRDTHLGARAPDIGSKFRLHLGPVDWDTYLLCLPGGRLRRQLDAVLTQALGRPMAYDVRVTLSPSPNRRLVLGSSPRCGLGRATWLGIRAEQVASASFAGRD